MTTSREIFESVLSGSRSGNLNIRGDQVVMDCPFCGKEGHFYVHVNRGWYRCFKCTATGSMAGFLSDDPVRWRKAISGVSSPCPVVSPPWPSVTSDDIGGLPLSPLIPSDLPPWPVPGMSEIVSARMGRATAYTRGRGMTDDQIKTYRVSVSPGDNRVYFPYWDDRGLSFYVARSMTGEEPKTLEPGTTKPLYGAHITKPGKTAVLVEGVFDHLATPNSYSLMGHAINSLQLSQLKNTEVVFVILDPDMPLESNRMAQLLRRHGKTACSVDMVCTRKDPADLGHETMRGLVMMLNDIPVRKVPTRLVVNGL